MGCAKLFFLALCCMQTSASFANEDPENCSALRANDAQGQRVLLQHSELRHSGASLHTQTSKDLLGYILLGNGQCVDMDGNLDQLGWSSCTCGKPTGSACTAGACVSVEVCAADCNAEPRCAAFGYHPGHCWLYGDTVESVAVNKAFDWYQCFAKGPTTTSTTTTTTTTAVLTPPTCSRPSNWCTANGGEYYSESDCNGDGILDRVCEFPDGMRFIMLSGDCEKYNNGQAPPCGSLEASTTTAAPTTTMVALTTTAAPTTTMVVLTPPTCSRPSNWCTANGGEYYSESDCNGDGILDRVCEFPDGMRFIMLSGDCEKYNNGKAPPCGSLEAAASD